MIGGATTSAKHTAVKIAPQYKQPTIHVLDASRAVGVVEKLLNPERRDDLIAQEPDRAKTTGRVVQHRQQVKLVPYDDAVAHRFQTDWAAVQIDTPSFTGRRVLDDLPLEKLVPFIDWSPFFLTWELKGKYPRIFDDPKVGAEARKLFDDARRLLDEIVAKKLLTARGVYGFWPAASIGDDVALYTDDTRQHELTRFHFLRQQWERKGQTDFHSLADFIAPVECGRSDYLGAFAVTTGIGCDELAKKFDRDHDDYNSIMTKALADRLAEAFAEYLHEQARIDWGYGTRRTLTSDELIEEKYRGIRPAAGYPACSRPHRKANPVRSARRRKIYRHHAHRKLRHVPRRQRQRAVLRPSRKPLLRRRPHHARPGRRLRPPQRNAAGRNRTLALAEPRLRSISEVSIGGAGICSRVCDHSNLVDSSLKSCREHER